MMSRWSAADDLPLLIGLSAVIVAVEDDTAAVLTTSRDDAVHALPFGRFDPDAHRTFDLSLRGWVREQTGFELGYVEQLYTFGDKDRETPEATLASAPPDARVISVGYLALAPNARKPDANFEADWLVVHALSLGRPSWRPARYHRRRNRHASPHGPWGMSAAWNAPASAFGLDGQRWVEERVLERYELLYEAGLVSECARDVGLPEPDIHLGKAMAS